MNHDPLDRRSIRMNLVHTRCEQVHTPTLPAQPPPTANGRTLQRAGPLKAADCPNRIWSSDPPGQTPVSGNVRSNRLDVFTRSPAS